MTREPVAPRPSAPIRAILLDDLESAVDRLVGQAEAVGDPDMPVAGQWSARDTVAHVVFWHESFARNVADLVAGRQPVPLAGTYAQLAARTRVELGDVPMDRLLERLLAAQAGIRTCILDRSLELIPYRRGSRSYGPDEHLVVVRDHVLGHAADLHRAMARARRSGRAGATG